MEAKHEEKEKSKKSATGMFVVAFFVMFLAFMVWYFIICSNIAVAPSDFALVTIGVVTAVECIAAAFIKTRPSGTELTDSEKRGIEFGAQVVAKALNIEAPYMQEVRYGTAPSTNSDEEGCG